MSSSKEEFSKLAQQLEKFLRSKLSNDVSITGSLARLHGGFDTDTYAFSIENPPLNFPHELVLRHYQTRGESMRVVFESTMQSVARNAGHPVAHVPIDSSGHLLDNRPFLIMERLPGSALGDLLGDQSVLQQLPQIMAKLQLGLHKINSSGLKSKLEESGVNIEFMSPLIMLKRVTALANACKEPKLLTVNSWLVDNWPNQPQTPTICHGDFHTNNILYLDGKVTGLIDWGSHKTNFVDRATRVG